MYEPGEYVAKETSKTDPPVIWEGLPAETCGIPDKLILHQVSSVKN